MLADGPLRDAAALAGDAGALARDTGALAWDAGDASSACRDIDVVVEEDVYRLVRAREGAATRLAIGWFFPRIGARAVEIWDLEFEPDGTPRPRVHPPLEATAGAQPAAAAMRGDQLALAIDQVETHDELVVIDLATDRVIGRRILDEALSAGFVTHAWIAISETRALSSVALPSGGSRLRIHDTTEASLPIVFETSTDLAEGPATAVAIARTEPAVRAVIASATALRIDEFAAEPGRPIDIDGATVLEIDGTELRVDGIAVGTLEPGTTSFEGRPTIAIGARRVLAVATNRGLRWSVDALGAAIAWRAPSTAFLAGLPVAHADAERAGLFFVEPALGAQPARLRYVGMCAR